MMPLCTLFVVCVVGFKAQCWIDEWGLMLGFVVSLLAMFGAAIKLTETRDWRWLPLVLAGFAAFVDCMLRASL